MNYKQSQWLSQTAYNTYRLRYTHGRGLTIEQEAYAALSTLAGKPLPIYNGGTWEQLNSVAERERFGFGAWRYTR